MLEARTHCMGPLGPLGRIRVRKPKRLLRTKLMQHPTRIPNRKSYNRQQWDRCMLHNYLYSYHGMRRQRHRIQWGMRTFQ